eukprot:4071487-Prymnesium_polylepis.1
MPRNSSIRLTYRRAAFEHSPDASPTDRRAAISQHPTKVVNKCAALSFFLPRGGLTAAVSLAGTRSV